jgi:hypothetical protein
MYVSMAREGEINENRHLITYIPWGMRNVCVDNIEKFVDGKSQNVVNPEVIAISRLP